MPVMEAVAPAVRPTDQEWHEGVPALEGGRPRGGRALLLAVALSAGLVVVASLWGAGQVLAFRAAHAGRILPGAEVEGVELTGLNRPAALAALEAALVPRLDRAVALTWGSERFEVTPRSLGAVTDVERLVDEALARSSERTWLELARMRWLGSGLGYRRSVALTVAQEPVAAFVDEVAAGVDRPSADARIDVQDAGVTLFGEQVGLAVIREPTALGLQQAVVSGADEVPLGVEGLAPQVTAADLGEVLVVDQSERVVSLYEGGQLARSWDVASGTSTYPTPLGEFEVGVKRDMPSWYNPAPDTWGADMPASIPPGPGNPLGLRALNWIDAEGRDDGIRFHGTQAVSSIGNAASHGCVRMRNADVVELFDLVEVGARILSVP